MLPVCCPKPGSICLLRQQTMPICRPIRRTGATGLEPATPNRDSFARASLIGDPVRQVGLGERQGDWLVRVLAHVCPTMVRWR